MASKKRKAPKRKVGKPPKPLAFVGAVFGGLASLRSRSRAMTSEDDDVKETHRRRHEFLHAALDELAADFVRHTQRLPSKTSLLDFMFWAAEQAKDPTEDTDPNPPACGTMDST